MIASEVQGLLDLLDSASPWSLLLALGVFSFAPVFTVRVFVHLYPPGHPRRAELIADLYKLKRITRIFYASEVVAAAITEGTGERIKARRLAPIGLRELRGQVWKAAIAALVTGAIGMAVVVWSIIAKNSMPGIGAFLTGAWFTLFPGIMWVLAKRLLTRMTAVDIYKRTIGAAGEDEI